MPNDLESKKPMFDQLPGSLRLLVVPTVVAARAIAICSGMGFRLIRKIVVGPEEGFSAIVVGEETTGRGGDSA